MLMKEKYSLKIKFTEADFREFKYKKKYLV